MKTKSLGLFLVIFSLLVSSCSWFGKKIPSVSPNFITLPSNGLHVIDGINYLGLSVISKITDTMSGDNILISPLNLSAVMTLLCQGAGNATKDIIKSTLHFNGLEEITINSTFKTLMEQLGTVDHEIDFLPANALWIRNGFMLQPDYMDKAKTYLHVDIFVQPFNNQYLLIMNNWVKDKTNGKIDKYFKQVDPNDMMDLVNAYYFTAAWYDGFNPDKTEKQPFTLENSQKVQVEMMHDVISQCRYMQNDSVSVAEIYFGRGNYSLILVVPRANDGIDGIARGLNPDTWNTWISALSQRQPVDVMLPKLNFNRFYDLRPYLLKLGLAPVFDTTADFSGISQGLYLTRAFQKTVIKITERGSGYSGGIIKEHTKPQYSIAADRPFLFVVRETTTGVMVLLGIIKNPNI